MVGEIFTSHFYCMLNRFLYQNWLIALLFLAFSENIFAQRLELGLADSTLVKNSIVLDTTPRSKPVVVDTVVEAIPLITEKTTKEQKALSENKKSAERHSPTKAALLSTALPGLGQTYNKKFWKIPIVYAGFAGLGFWLGTNIKNYNIYNKAYEYRMDNNPATIDQFIDQYNAEDLRTLKRFYRRNLDLSIVLIAVWYGLNIVDAAVDAHLFEFDVSDNLSLRIDPIMEYHSRANNFTGFKVGLRF
jgi:hypothetical protein